MLERKKLLRPRLGRVVGVDVRIALRKHDEDAPLDQKLDRRIAIKCAKKGFGGRLPPEVRHASDVSHPNVCKIFEIHTTSAGGREIDFITMEYLEGETLADRLRKGRLPDEDALAIARQICAGLAEAHRNEVVHGDLKASNIILTSGPGGGLRAVITDFGLARGQQASHDSGRPSEVIGTPMLKDCRLAE